jgi:type IV secretory pathway VirJ component
MVLLVSGEGGWRRFDDLLAGMMSDAGFWVGGVDSMQYFWRPQDDRQALAADCRALAGALASAAGRPATAPLVLAGFSFGADIAPWVAGAGGWGDRVRGLVMIGPDETGSLEFRVSEMLGFQPKDHTFPVAEALRGVAGTPVLFLHGAKDKHSAARALSEGAALPKRLIVVPGADHHFSGREKELEAALRDGMTWLLRGGAEAPTPAPGRP